MGQSVRIAVLGAITVAAGIVVAFLPRIPQPLDYHNFADQRTLLAVPNFLNVISNLPFLLAGVWGLMLTVGLLETTERRFIAPGERWPYLVLSLGVVLTCFGSAYYHLAPNNARLVWDRLPMTLAFMSLLSAMLMERVNLRGGLIALGPLLILGLASVLTWYASEERGAGDLRLYLMVQFYTLILILLILWLFPARYTHGGDLLVAMGFYVLAKVLEVSDRPIFKLGHIVSGHTLKHLAAALGVYWVFRMLARRRPLQNNFAN
ncbi:MAG: ceramidase domain-containing protein [Terriglobia bacterium]